MSHDLHHARRHAAVRMAHLPNRPVVNRGHYLQQRGVNLVIDHPHVCSCSTGCEMPWPQVYVRLEGDRCLRTRYLVPSTGLTRRFCTVPRSIVRHVDCAPEPLPSWTTVADCPLETPSPPSWRCVEPAEFMRSRHGVQSAAPRASAVAIAREEHARLIGLQAMSGDFFPYHPLRLRLWLLGSCLVALALTIWAVIGFTQSQSPREILRAGLSLGLAAAMGVGFFRFRPRKEWGVRVTPLAVLVSRPRTGLIEVPWGSVKEVRRLGEKRDTLALWLVEEQRVLVPSHLFARRADFEALARAIEERMPPSRYDA